MTYKERPDRIALGAMYLGTRLDEQASFAVLDRFVEAGGTWIDTSNNYSFWEHESGFGGQSETFIGRWMRANPGAPVKISTKVGAQPTRVGGFPDHLEGLGHDVVRRSIQQSLDRLQVGHVDLYWAHVEDRDTHLDDMTRVFDGLVSEGLVGAWGLSNHPSWRMAEVRMYAAQHNMTPPAYYQQRYSYLQPAPGAPVEGQPLSEGMLTTDGIALLARAPSLTGWVYTSLLLGAYDRDDKALPPEYVHPGNDRRMIALDQVARQRGLNRGQIVLAWLTCGRPAMTPIVGCSSPDQVNRALEGARTELTAAEIEQLNSAY